MTVKLHHDRKQQEAVHDNGADAITCRPYDHGPGIVDCHDVGVAKLYEDLDLR